MKKILSAFVLLCVCTALSAQMLPVRKGHSKRLFDEPLKVNSPEMISQKLSSLQKGRAELRPMAATTSIRSIVLLVEFPDKSFTFTDIEDKITNMLNAPGYSYNGANGSVKEYLEDQFLGDVTFTFDVVRVPVLSKNRAYYGKNASDGSIDEKVPDMVKEACIAVDDKVDFSKYAVNGEVPMVFVFFAGEDETVSGKEDLIWPHSYYVSGNLKLDGVKISEYACTSEVEPEYTSATRYKLILAPIGTFCHEYSHTLGLFDYYDTDYEESGGYSAACWAATNLMDAGNYCDNGNTPPPYSVVDYFTIDEIVDNPIAAVKNINYVELEAGKNYTISPFSPTNKTIHYIQNGNNDEFYLFDVRSSSVKWNAFTGGTGMLVYHIDLSTNPAGYSDTYRRNMTAIDRWSYNEINCRPTYQCIDLIEADGRSDALTSQVSLDAADNGLYFPYKTKTSLDSKVLKFRTGKQPSIVISNIARQPDGSISFSVSDNGGGIKPVTVPQVGSVTKLGVYQTVAVFSFTADIPTQLMPVITYNELIPGAKKIDAEVTRDADGNYYARLDCLTPRTTYSMDIHFEDQGVTGVSKQVTFLTQSKSTYGPYLDVVSAEGREPDGTYHKGAKLALPVSNVPTKNAENSAIKVSSIDYSFNGSPVEFKNGFFVVSESGDIKVTITYSDGSRSVIYKYIRVK